MAQHLDQASLDMLTHDVLPSARLLMNERPLQTDDIGEQTLRKTMLAGDFESLLTALLGES